MNLKRLVSKYTGQLLIETQMNSTEAANKPQRLILESLFVQTGTNITFNFAAANTDRLKQVQKHSIKCNKVDKL
jgi:hypothetical protein